MIFDFYANEIFQPENMYLFVDLKNSQTSFEDISQIRFPNNSKIKYLSFPESLYNSGIVNYNGNFSGFLTDFVAYGTLESRMGTLKTDLAVVPDTYGNISYKGRITSSSFKLGELIQDKNIGELTFNGNVNGKYNKKNKSVSGQLNGNIVTLDAFGYIYQNILLNGHLNNKNFDGALSVNDPNLQLDFSGNVNLNPKIPVFDFKLNLKKAMTEKLGLENYFPPSEIAFNMTANFTGNDIDNLKGNITVNNGTFKNKNGILPLGNIELASIPGIIDNKLTFVSPFFDLDIKGKYNFAGIADAFNAIINKYLPDVGKIEHENLDNNNFTYQISAKNLDSLLNVIYPKLIIKTPFLLYEKIDPLKSVFELKNSIPSLAFKNLEIQSIFFSNKPINDEFISKIRLGQLKIIEGPVFQNIIIETIVKDNKLSNNISWKNRNKVIYSGEFQTQTVFSRHDSASFPFLEIKGYSIRIIVSDSVWQIPPFTATVDSSENHINRFKITNKEQSLELDGWISKDNSKPLTMNLKNINLSQVGGYIGKDLKIEGIINGNAGVYDVFDQKVLFSDLKISNFKYRNQIIGDVLLTNRWDNINSELNSELVIMDNKRRSLYANGTFDPKTRNLDYTANLDRVSVVLLESFLSSLFYNMHGDASGKVRIHGTPDNVLLNGAIKGINAGLTVDYTKVSYFLSDSVYFRGNIILFDRITFQDVNKNRGILNGTITHTNFSNMIYNLNISSPKITVFNTTSADNELFYGQLISSGNINITGKGSKVNMSGSATTMPGTNLNIFLEYESDIEKYDFIEFVSPRDSVVYTPLKTVKKNESELTMNFTITATPEARAQLIYNSQIGDVIKA